MERAATIASSLEVEQDSEAQIRFEAASKQSNDLPLSRVNTLRSGEDNMKLKELMEFYTKLSDRVLDLETTKTAQAKEIDNLKKRVNKLEKRKRSRTPGMNLFKISTSRRRSLGEEDASKQGKNLKQGKQRSIFAESDVDEGFDADMDEVFKDIEGDAEQVISAAADEVSTGDAVNTAGTEVNTASASVTTDGVSVSTADLVTTVGVETLMEIRSARPKAKGIAFREPGESTTITTPTLISSKIKDKGKAKIIEPEKPLKRKDQIMIDEEVALKLQVELQAELEEEERLVKQREEDAKIAEWDDVQAMMDADYELAARLQAEEQGELIVEEKSKLFVKLMDKRKKHFARLRAKDFDEVQKAFDKTMSWINSFVDMDSELVKGSETRAKGCSKRAREDLQ
ncbi:hypothetical protein Tco_1030142 [Tanacetum coccineum]|uniref:Uncharacterized protein n=1 Tax=Tanacetum coccineum TaxID=301880 RepID=A0ABQ5G5Y4_9ASTR